MSFLNRLERVLGPFAIANLALYLVIGQVFVLFAAMLQLLPLEKLDLVPALVQAGDWWRIVTFMFVIPVPGSTLGFVFTAFGWYLFYIMGRALEDYWGTVRFNAYLFAGYALTVGLAFIAPTSPVTNIYILGSVFLAFAYLNPDFELTLFFILPVRIKWLALIAWALNLVLFVRGDLAVRLQIGAAAGSFALFFAGDMLRTMQSGKRARVRRVEQVVEETKPRHTCHVCGKTDRSHPQLDFRYCSKCAGDQCYCPEHIKQHAHVVADDDRKTG